MNALGTMNAPGTILFVAALVVAFTIAPAGASDLPPLDGYPEPAEHDVVAAPFGLDGPDAYAVVHVRAHQITPTVLFALEDEVGDLVMFAWTTWDWIYITDGPGSDGNPFQFQPVEGSNYVSTARHDVLLEGDTYRYQVRTGSNEQWSIEAATLTHATEAVFSSEERLDELQAQLWESSGKREIWNPRILPSTAAAAAFGDLTSLDETAWAAWPSDEANVLVEGTQDGDHGVGRLRVDSPWEAQPQGLLRHGAGTDTLPDERLSYAYVSAPGDEAYLVEASFRPWRLGLNQLGGISDHQAVLAGISGPADEPQVEWALVMHSGVRNLAQTGEEAPAYDRFHLSLIGPDGSRTIISPSWSTNEWHFVRALVDEENRQITVQVDNAEQAFRFSFEDLGPSDRIATGDVWTHHPHWTGGGNGYYDNLAVMPWELAE